MITPSQAEALIMRTSFQPGAEKVLLSESLNRKLAEDLLADTDLPPFDRVMMDGIALRYSAIEKGIRSFTILGVQRAGQAALTLTDESACFEIMTGAVCSSGCDTVVPYEHIRIEDSFAHIDILPVAKGKNIHMQGSDKKAGALLVAAGSIVSPAEIGIAASIGKSTLSVQRLPRILICSTGDELIDISETPLPHQIRRSNVYALQALIKSVGIEADSIHLADEKIIILEALEQALNSYDVLILSGGVSKGKFDLIPEVLNELGVETIFHTIAQRPGKPMWFGTSQKTVVFALPGNPVSTLACAARYVLPWLKAQMGIESTDIRIHSQETIAPHEKLTLFLPVRVSANLSLQAQLIHNQGSGDFSGLSGMTGFIEVEPGAHSPAQFRYFPLG